MKLLRQLFDFYLDASIHVALAVLSLIYITVLFFNISLDIHLALFVFFCTIASYNFIKFGVEAEKYILVSSSYHRYIQFFSFIALGLAAYHANFLSIRIWIVLAALAVLVGLYSLPVLPQIKKLRNLGILKILLIGFVWGGTTVILPYLAVSEHLPWDAHMEALQRLLLVLILMMPFEIRDLAYDDPSLRTIPQRYGVKITKIIGSVAVLIFFVITYLKDSVSSTELISKVVLSILLLLILWKTKKEQPAYFASFWVEAVPILWLIVVLGLQFAVQ